MGFPLHGEEADIGGQILYSSDWYKRKETSKQGSVNRPSVQPSKGMNKLEEKLTEDLFPWTPRNFSSFIFMEISSCPEALGCKLEEIHVLEPEHQPFHKLINDEIQEMMLQEKECLCHMKSQEPGAAKR